MSGAMTSLSKLAEDNPKSPRLSDQLSSLVAAGSTRTRVESTPLFASGESDIAGRRKSEDWSSRSWRMGEGPSVSEALGEFGDGVKKKQSEELLGGKSQGSGFGHGVIGRGRGGSLGRDSRLYGDETARGGDEIESWGQEIEGVRIGEVSALTGEGGSRSIFSRILADVHKLRRRSSL
jgi:hypothetical protein